MRASPLRRNLVTGLITLIVAVFVAWSETCSTIIYVDDDNTGGPWDGSMEHPYQHIQDGINNSSSGDTVFVFNGVYYENVVLNKPVALIGENRDSTVVDGGGTGDVVSASAPAASISEFTIQNSGSDENNAGVHGSAYVNGNVIKNNLRGIRAHSSCKIVGNIILSNVYSGIRLDEGSSNDTIYGNTISNNGGGGVVLEWCCDNNNITKNIITNNMIGVYLETSSNYNVISENIIADNASWGVYPCADASDNFILRNTITNNWAGVRIESSWRNIVSENMIASNYYYGIDMDCGPNTYSGNIIKNSETGIFVWGRRNTITANTITNCTQAIHLRWARYAKVVGNSITDNWLGINLDIAFEDTIVSNIIANNANYGVSVSSSSNNNHLYHNNFINNAQNATDQGSNIWDNDYPSGGNYWDDYTGVDADGDGIGDTPYNIPGGVNQDRYPLTYIRGDANGDKLIELGDVVYLINYIYRNGPAPDPWPAGDANSDGVVDIVDVYYLIEYLYRGGPPPCE